MKILTCHQYAASIFLMLIAASSHAQIYKWTDAKGVVHYSEKKEHANAFKTDELKIKSQPASSQTPAQSSAEYWSEQERLLKQRQVNDSIKKASEPPPKVTRPKALTNGRSDDTAVSKCNLARDVINGSVRHSDGSPTDKYDLDVAANDIRSFCH